METRFGTVAWIQCNSRSPSKKQHTTGSSLTFSVWAKENIPDNRVGFRGVGDSREPLEANDEPCIVAIFTGDWNFADLIRKPTVTFEGSRK